MSYMSFGNALFHMYQGAKIRHHNWEPDYCIYWDDHTKKVVDPKGWATKFNYNEWGWEIYEDESIPSDKKRISELEAQVATLTNRLDTYDKYASLLKWITHRDKEGII